MQQTANSGVALVMSLIILTMMLVMALPFALSQNISIESSDQFSLRQQVEAHRQSVESLGLGLSSNAFSELYSSPGTRFHHALLDDITDTIFPTPSSDGNPIYDSTAYPLRVTVDVRYLRQLVWASDESESIQVGLSLEDESGRIDINALSAAQWIDLLNECGITYKNSELAAGFINYRYSQLGGAPFTYIEQLLLCAPYHATDTPRPQLTSVELARLRPHVTVHGMGQGKDGQLELASVFVADPAATPKIGIWDVHPSQTLKTPQSQVLFGGERDLTNVDQTPKAVTTPIAQALNLNTASEVALKFMGFPDLSNFVSAGERIVFQSHDDLNAEMLKRLDPLHDVNKERPPIDIKSSGVVTVHAHAAAQNRAGNPVTNTSSSITALALSSQSDITILADNQHDFTNAIKQRWHSLLSSWPRALERGYLNIVADESDTTNAALIPKPLPGIEQRTVFDSDDANWLKLFRGTDEDLQTVPALDANNDLTTLGVRSSSSNEIIYDHQKSVGGKTTSFSKPLINTTGAPQVMEPRHISFWLTTPNTTTFNTNWDNKIVPIFEIRAPEDNTGSPIDVVSTNGHVAYNGSIEPRTMEVRKEHGDNNKQHLVSLYYDGRTGQEHFVLRIAGEAIEYPDTAYGAPVFPQDDPNTDTIDERTLGGPLSGATHPLVNPVQQTYTEFRYIFKLEADRAYHLNTIIHHTRPGGIKFFIDNLIGRDLNESSGYAVASIKNGDHITTPYPLRLNVALPEVIQNMDPALAASTREIVREQAEIEASAIALPPPWDTIIPGPEQWLPDNSSNLGHGHIYMNGEFIAYKNWIQSGSTVTFYECKRGKRQVVDNLNDLTDAIPTEQVPDPSDPSNSIDISSDSYRRQMPAHPIGSRVWPGGVSFNRDQKLYRGGSILKFNFNGNPAQDHKIKSHSANVVLYTDTTIALDDAVEADYFPLYGYIKVRGRVNADDLPPTTPDGDYDTIEEYMYYTRTAGSPILNIEARNVFGSNAGNADFMLSDPLDASVTYDIDVDVISFEVEGDPSGRYATASNGQDDSTFNTWGVHPVSGDEEIRQSYDVAYLQLYDVTNTASLSYGHIEWIPYTDYITAADGRHYFLNRGSGFGGGRGAMGTHFDSTRIFPPATRVIPVQNAGSKGYLLEMGDVVTISNQQLGSNTITMRTNAGTASTNSNTWQAVVRYVSANTKDSYNSWTGTYHYNKTVRFAFTDELPDIPDAAKFSVWPSYGDTDLSLYDAMALSSDVFNNFNLPYVNAWATGFNTDPGNPDDRLVYIGLQDKNNLDIANNFLPTPHQTHAVGIIDSIMARKPASGTEHKVARILNLTGPGNIGDIIEVSKSNTGFSDNNSDRSGLIVIDGEVLAYIIENVGTTNAELSIVGRGLFGSDLSAHIGVGDEVLRLPIGPVAVLNTSINNAFLGQVDLKDISGISTPLSASDPDRDANALPNCHSYLFMKNDGSAMESIQLISANQNVYTAPWLRGLYNSPIQDWDSNDLVIAWDPRYGSALPEDQTHLSSQEHRSALLRSRCFTFLAQPLRIFGMQLPGSAGDPSVTVFAGNNPNHTPFDFELRALDRGFDWADPGTPFAKSDKPHDEALDLPAAPNDVFERNWLPESSDFELRVHWRYHDSAFSNSADVAEQLQALADFANSAASIKSVEIKARAGVHILDSK